MMSEMSTTTGADRQIPVLSLSREQEIHGDKFGALTPNGKVDDGTQIRRHDSLGKIENFAAATLAAAPLAPVIAMLATVEIAVRPILFVHFANDPETPPAWWDHSLLASIVVLVVMWLFLAGLYYVLRFTSAKGANAGNFHEITAQLEELDAWLATVHHDGVSNAEKGSDDQPGKRSAYLQVDRHRKAIEAELRPGGMGWVLGTSYVQLWQRLHRAQEALVEIEPQDAVIRDAQLEYLRVKGSAIDNEDMYLGLLNQAIDVLRLGSAGNPPASSASNNGTGTPSDPTKNPSLRPPETINDAVLLVRTVRSSVNEFRDGRRSALVRARNYLLLAMAVTGVTTYVLLWIAIAAGTPTSAIVAATTLYLVGALVGLFSHLYAGAGTDSVVDDFGLTYARLLVTLVLSGIASVLAVVLIAVAAPVATSNTASATDALLNAFNLRNAPTNILTAAVFGLTPGLIITRLTEKTDAYKGDLKTSTPASR